MRLTMTMQAFLKSIPEDPDKRLACIQAWIVVTAMTQTRMFMHMERALSEVYSQDYEKARKMLMDTQPEETTTHDGR